MNEGPTYLFDWGNTLMVDFTHEQGKMCQWKAVKEVEGASEVLKSLSRHGKIYVATNAQDSTEEDIQKALARVKLDQFISGYFCRDNVGIPKGSREFYLRIADSLDVATKSLIMVGDTYDKDIQPAIEAGLTAIWFNPSQQPIEGAVEVKQIRALKELL